jgi:hypothetical protein
MESPKNEDIPEPDPAAFIAFTSHEQAVNALAQVGFAGAATTASFTPEELTDAVNGLLKEEGIVLMDMTTAIPDTAHAAYQALTIAGFNAAAACKKDKNAAFIVMRTEANTPSFLFGIHWSEAQAFGKEVADTRIRSSPAPAAFVVFRERQVLIPAAACKVDVSIAARIVAYKITLKAEYFCCALCKTPFISSDKTGETISEIAVNSSGQMFLRSCVENLVRETGSAELREGGKVG